MHRHQVPEAELLDLLNMAPPSGILKARLDLLILKAVGNRSLHGYAVGQWLDARSGSSILRQVWARSELTLRW